MRIFLERGRGAAPSLSECAVIGVAPMSITSHRPAACRDGQPREPAPRRDQRPDVRAVLSPHPAILSRWPDRPAPASAAPWCRSARPRGQVPDPPAERCRSCWWPARSSPPWTPAPHPGLPAELPRPRQRGPQRRVSPACRPACAAAPPRHARQPVSLSGDPQPVVPSVSFIARALLPLEVTSVWLPRISQSRALFAAEPITPRLVHPRQPPSPRTHQCKPEPATKPIGLTKSQLKASNETSLPCQRISAESHYTLSAKAPRGAADVIRHV